MKIRTLAEQIGNHCRHFNGIQNERCSAGIAYADVRLDHEPKGVGVVSFPRRSWPCMRNNNPAGAVCASQSFPTSAEVAAEVAEIDIAEAWIDAGRSPCCDAALDESQVITAGRHKGHGPRFCSTCRKVAFLV